MRELIAQDGLIRPMTDKTKEHIKVAKESFK